MKCFECGKGTMRRRTASTTHEIKGISFEVEGPLLVCSNCGFKAVPQDQVAAHGRVVDQRYRELAGLLTAQEIAAARKRLKMNQAQFAGYLGVGEASVKRWEAGALQDKSSDELIRFKTDPEFAEHHLHELRRKLGLQAKPTSPEKIYVSLPPQRRRPEYRWQDNGELSRPTPDALTPLLNLILN